MLNLEPWSKMIAQAKLLSWGDLYWKHGIRFASSIYHHLGMEIPGHHDERRFVSKEEYDSFFKNLFSKNIPSGNVLQLYVSAKAFSNVLFNNKNLSVVIEPFDKPLDECRAPAYVDMENGMITFEPALIFEAIKERYRHLVMSRYFSYEFISDFMLGNDVLYVFAFLFYHEVAHLIYNKPKDQNFIDALLAKWQHRGMNERSLHRMFNYAADHYDEDQFRLQFGTKEFSTVVNAYDIGRFLMRGNEPEVIDPRNFEDPFEGLQYKILMERFTFKPESFDPLTKQIFAKVLTNHTDSNKRKSDYVDIIMSALSDSIPVSPPSPTSDVGSRPIDGAIGNIPVESLVEEMTKELTECPPGLIVYEANLRDYEPQAISPVLRRFKDTISANLNDEWRDFLTKYDAPLDGFTNGKLDLKHAYKTALTPRVFTKSIDKRRESDLVVEISVDFSGSMFMDLGRYARRSSTSNTDGLFSSDDLLTVAKDIGTYATQVERQRKSSVFYCAAFSLLLVELFHKVGNKVNLSFFSGELLLIDDFIPDGTESQLGSLFSIIDKHDISGGGTTISNVLSTLPDRLASTSNNDRLLVVLTDGGFYANDDVKQRIEYCMYEGIFILFVGIGIELRDELLTYSNVYCLSYTDGDDLSVRFPADFAVFIKQKYFMEV